MYQCDVQTKKMRRDPGMWRSQECWRCSFHYKVKNIYIYISYLEVCWSSDHATNPLLLVLYIRLWMWASGPSWPDCSRLDIVAASIFAMLAAYSGSCVPETTLTCWTLNSLLLPFNMDIYINAPLECGVVRHNWLCEWMNSSFLRGARLQKFCFKKWK